jgi:hypothetical protein
MLPSPAGMSAEAVILVTVFAIGAGAFALEALGPGAARAVGIAVCLALVVLVGGSLIARARRIRRPTGGGPPPPS